MYEYAWWVMPSVAYWAGRCQVQWAGQWEQQWVLHPPSGNRYSRSRNKSVISGGTRHAGSDIYHC